MDKMIQWIKHKRWQLLPLFMWVCLSLSIVIFNVLYEGKVCKTQVDYVTYNDLGCETVVGDPIQTFLAMAFFSVLPLVFVRRVIIFSWLIFVAIYMYISYKILINTHPVGGWFNDRAFYAAELGLGLSAITILWAIIHSLIIRHYEKKKKIN